MLVIKYFLLFDSASLSVPFLRFYHGRLFYWFRNENRRGGIVALRAVALKILAGVMLQKISKMNMY